MSDPTGCASTQGQQIFSDPKTILACLTLVVNFGIAIWNFKFTRRNLRTDRKHRIDFAFYDLMVLGALKELVCFSSTGGKIFVELKGKINASSDLLKTSREAIDLLQNKHQQIEIETVPMLKAFSPQLGKEISKLLEDLYDQSTEIFSKFAHAKPTETILISLNDKFSENQKKFGQELTATVKKFCPATY